MTQHKQASSEDLDAFLAAVDGATPLSRPDRVSFEAPKPSPRPRQRERDEAAVLGELLHAPLAVDDWLDLGGADSFLRSGLPRTLLRDLRRGRWSIQNHVDLHGMNRHEAHAEVAVFLSESMAEGRRCLRIVHGRGNGSPGREAILRQLVKVWLSRCQEVLAFCHAPPCDGGDGALWVLLKAGGKRR
ncbi:MAG: putative DNA endonuclease SmrA [Candidatus Accumulibacter regalis]|uniref:DNA endonuclease SmrA n=1 Tax=Accumulibacter regalis TaxID=522306 RepID=A0A011QMN8_ACCRE|nr:Smr/MutS family protein [Accumulibacter sp.]EXI90310.1 MAG: putative DNA endonuclease SmrA [Candidatus Accumulibacter regalis]HRE72045.1 Smr/MutS family protein [Accumulibacter sp.]HRE87350.1 Smr/MutS family protein [Accumulibacter sp.]